MRFHCLSVAHTITNKEYVACAFTQKVLKFCAMMHRRGHHVIHYGHPDSEVECTEHVNVISRETYNRVYGDYDWHTQNFKFDLTDEAYQEYNSNTVDEIRKRKQPGDLVLAFWGQGNKAICDALSDMYVIEPGIGYSQAFANYRCYETYALMHANLGLHNVQYSGGMPWYHVVIPNYFDPTDFEFSDTKKDYFLYLGRITRAKGVDLIIQATKDIGAKLVIAGQGSPSDLDLDKWPEHVEYVGYANSQKRSELMKHAKATIIMSTYLEPFAGTMIESFFCGTPVISTDWGTFAENNLHGVTGYRCRFFDHMIWALQNIHRIDPYACRTWAQNFTFDKVAPMYEEYFQFISPGWYHRFPDRVQLDWMVRDFPTPKKPYSIDAFFQCYNQVFSADKMFESYRKCYPHGKVVMVNDGGDRNMEELAKKYGAEYTYKENIGICYWKNPTEWLERFFEGVQQLESEYFVMQEEDVFHVRPVDPTKLTFDICGTNPDALFPQEIVDYIYKETGRTCTHYSGSGGCFFRTSFFKELAKTDWRRHMEHLPHRWLWADVALSFVTCLYGGTIGYCTECVEIGRLEYETQKNPAVIHQYKMHYQKILWVTAFRDIGRKDWAFGGRSVDEYFECFERIVKPLSPHFVCFADEPYASRIRELGVEHVYPHDLQDTFVPRFMDRQKEILQDSNFIARIPEELRMCPEYRVAEYSLTLYSKPCFVRRAAQMFPDYTHYAFIDFGYAKTPDVAPPFPLKTNHVVHDKIMISSFRQLLFDENHEARLGDYGSTNPDESRVYNWNNPFQYLKEPIYAIQGNVWIVPKKCTQWLEDTWSRTIERFQEIGVVAGHDEPVWLSVIHDFRNRFHIHVKTDWQNWNWIGS